MFRVGVLLLLSSCLVGPYRKHRTNRVSARVEGETREVRVGERLDPELTISTDAVAFAPDVDTAVRVTSKQQCRRAIFGTRVTRRAFLRYPSGARFGFFLLSGVGLITGGAIVGGLAASHGRGFGTGPLVAMGVGVYLWGVAIRIGTASKRAPDGDGEEVIDRKPNQSEWTSTIHDCPAVEAVPAPNVPVRLTASFKDTSWHYSQDQATDGVGVARFSNARARVARLATMCGEGKLWAGTPPPNDPAGFPVEATSPSNTGSPSGVVTVRLPMTPVSLPVAPEGPATFDGVPGSVLHIAQACYQAKVDACVVRERGTVTQPCEERCAQTRGSLNCLLAWRRDVIVAGPDPAARTQADTMRRECQVRANASPEDEGSCVQSCIATDALTRCK